MSRRSLGVRDKYFRSRTDGVLLPILKTSFWHLTEIDFKMDEICYSYCYSNKLLIPFVKGLL